MDYDTPRRRSCVFCIEGLFQSLEQQENFSYAYLFFNHKHIQTK